ncbi:MAG TPA: hypothetical protein DET40_13095 [Lentisphaeria bacterium]|nr:MAG: hypothetical protein A2X45_17405 [Lentisphaerae bacterium GWF2_50_93]HCE44478.1 hypothetical protein [Lentisphaeria bacterium]
MKYAIISDIHANLHAWNAAKADIEAQEVEVIVCLGDIIGYGPRPFETLDSVCAAANYIILGNHEAVIEGSFDKSQFNDEAWKMIEWTGSQLDPATGKFFEQLPLLIEMDAGICKTLFVHGSANQPEAFNYILDDEDAIKSWNACEADLVFAGHTHETALFMVDGGQVINNGVADFTLKPGRRYIVNVGSIGMPREADFRASYCILDTDSGSVSFKRVSYDFDAFRKDVLDIIGESDQSRHVLSYFKESQRPLQEQLDFTPATESQLIARPIVHGERISIKLNSKSMPKQFRMKKEQAKNIGVQERKQEQEYPKINKKLWFIVCGFFLMVALVSMLVAIFIPAPRQEEQPGPVKKEGIILNVVQTKTDASANIANGKVETAKDVMAKAGESKVAVSYNRRDAAPVAPSELGIILETNFGDGTKYKSVSGQEQRASLPEGWNETSSWGNPACSYSFQSEGETGYLKCVSTEKVGKIQIYHSFAELTSSRTFNISVRVKGPAKTELGVAFVALEKPWKTYDSAILQLTPDWKNSSTMLTCGPTPAGIPIGFMIYTRSPGSMNIMSVKVEEISFSQKPK